ncbi:MULTISPECIES: metallophosphoesterase [unclassified Pantoea]|uniref:metallophosphoesterase n=1 Tax=unclassified Pantoea TaxID=2630326 RepID=UPI001CD21CB7|nr:MULTISPECIES: metallophosphoesterase [unclassified Pantoea]MCA1179491.1 metallophosphoesterase [Pantoea sp. alder69]MCA1251744.1 metallophosphoesterase [Pantoea sp. alder70]MCA1267919.1 metallophosphoesterase [Pantoea sp. alder81]
MFHLWILLPALYVCFRFVFPLKRPLSLKIFISLVVIAGCEFHLISRFVYGSMFSPELPYPLMILIGWFFGATIFFALFLLIIDFVQFLLKVFMRRHFTDLQPLKVVALTVGCIFSAMGIWGGIKVPEVKRLEITVKNLPPAFDGFTVVQLTDLHASRLLSRHWITSVVDRTNKLNADLITLTGDMADGTVEARREDVSPLASLHAKYGIWAITGNHEYYFNAPDLIKEYQHMGINFLLNKHVILHKDGSSLVLAGVNDEAATQYGQVGPSITGALQGIPKNMPILLLDHRPGNANENAAKDVGLQLSGHTHGGMITGLDILARPANNGFVSGLYSVNGMSLYVSNGTGIWNGFPLRIGQSSEITLITLRSPTSNPYR